MEPLYRVSRIASSAQLNTTEAVHIVGIHLTADAGASFVKIHQAADASGGTPEITVAAVANDSKWVDLSAMGGINLTQAYVELDGAEAVIFWE